MFTDKELLALWANDQKRRDFVKNYKVWGIWFVQPELDLTYYKYDLPGGGRIIAMEYYRDPYRMEGTEPVMCVNFYLQRGKCFVPSAASDYTVADRLKEIKATLHAEQKQRDSHCKRCGSRCLWHKPDGSVQCTVCMYLIQQGGAAA